MKYKAAGLIAGNPTSSIPFVIIQARGSLRKPVEVLGRGKDKRVSVPPSGEEGRVPFYDTSGVGRGESMIVFGCILWMVHEGKTIKRSLVTCYVDIFQGFGIVPPLSYGALKCLLPRISYIIMRFSVTQLIEFPLPLWPDGDG